LKKLRIFVDLYCVVRLLNALSVLFIDIPLSSAFHLLPMTCLDSRKEPITTVCQKNSMYHRKLKIKVGLKQDEDFFILIGTGESEG
jgi:hypothetical protein